MIGSWVMLDGIYAWTGWDIYMSNKFLTYITCSFPWCLEIGFPSTAWYQLGPWWSLNAPVNSQKHSQIICDELATA